MDKNSKEKSSAFLLLLKKNKKYVIASVILLILIIVLTTSIIITVKRKQDTLAEEPDIFKDYSIVISSDKTLLNVDETANITVKTEIFDSDSDKLKLISTNPDIISVEYGKVTGVSVGKAKIYAQIDDVISNEIEIECIVKMEKIDLDETSISLLIGDVFSLEATVFPENATNSDLVWTSSDEEIASIEEEGIKAKKVGKCIVTVTNVKENITATCEVEVKEKEEIKVEKKSSLHYVYNVPYYNQNSMGYPTGCEAVSAAMAAKYSGYNVSAASIIANTPTDERGIYKETLINKKEVEKEVQELVEVVVEKPSQEETESGSQDSSEETTDSKSNDENTTEGNEDEKPEVTYEYRTVIKKEIIEVPEEKTFGANPFTTFVGHPAKGYSQNSYGCFANPIVVSLRSLGVPCTDISGCSDEQLLSYIDNERPVVVWGTARGKAITYGVTWTYPDNSGTFRQLVGEHCMVLVGYDDKYVYLNDPAIGRGVTQTRSAFFNNFNILYRQAIVIN